MNRFSLPLMKRYVPVKRTDLDGKQWWCVFDFEKMRWSTLTCFGKYQTKRSCQQAIDYYIDHYDPHHGQKGAKMIYIQIAEHLYRCSCCGKLIECGNMNLLPVKCPHCGKE